MNVLPADLLRRIAQLDHDERGLLSPLCGFNCKSIVAPGREKGQRAPDDEMRRTEDATLARRRSVA